RINPSAQIVVTGCYATRCPDEVGDLPGVIRVVANDDKPSLISIVGSIPLSPAERESRQPDLTTASRFGNGDGSCGSAIEPGVAGRTAFTLRVQTGCAEHCSYCIIPSTRGAPRSVPIAAVRAKVDRVS